MLQRPCVLIFVGAWLAGCATSVPLPLESSLAAIVEDARVGRIDACRDLRWISWRLEHGEEGVARLKALRKLARSQEDSLEPAADADPYVWSAQRARLSGLGYIVPAALAAADESRWRLALAQQEQRIDEWRAAAAGKIGASGFAAAEARRAVWRRAYAAISDDLLADRAVESGIARCLYAPDEARAEADAGQLVAAALDREHWPSDVVDGDGATRAVLSFRGWDLGKAYLKRNMKRLDGMAATGKIPEGGWAYLRYWLEKDTNPRSLAARTFRATRLVRAFFASLAPPNSVGEELYRRVRVDQFAIYGESRLIHEFPKSAARDRAKKRLEASTAKIVKDNAEWLKVLLRDRDWFDDAKDGEDAARHGWLLIQHADHDRDLQRDVLRRMEPLLASGRVSRWHYAYLWDRVAVGDKRFQRYGTQMGCTKDKRGPEVGLEDPEHVDERRKEMGLGPWKDYVAAFGPCP